ncbi:SAC3/GANP/Nin1/mts3/eIF-3 p25 family-domain-containing protein [Myxozyma melibiosi]|uniref:Nuclear mRNA export factor n=1 Tax=Myxozyma melibiosi TaxID=54550 RepID=A0ABR1FBM6_9ASCO
MPANGQMRNSGNGSNNNQPPSSGSAFSNVNFFQGSQAAGSLNDGAKGHGGGGLGRGNQQKFNNRSGGAGGAGDDDWDAKNQELMRKYEATWTGDLQSLYEKLQGLRDKERIEMENRGLVDRPDTQKSLTDAINFVGTCMEMCPVFERVRRSAGNLVKSYERGADGNIDKNLAVKEFSRPAAGQPPPLPSDVRPPGILQNTLTYLIDNIVPQLPEAHAFLWDRTRSIRQDFTYQNYSGYEAIDCNERIARIHIYALHTLAGDRIEGARQQELEQFNKALQTLSEFYADVRKSGAQAPNEAEFQAYRLLSLLRDPDLDRQVQDLPKAVFLDRRVQLALELRSMAQQNNISERGYTNTENAQNLFVRFFKLIKSPAVPFLFACLAEVHFNDIRMWALRAMAGGYHRRGKPYVSANLVEMLGCNDTDELHELCDHFQIARRVEDGVECVDVMSWNDAFALGKPPFHQAYSTKLVHSKLGDQSASQLIHGNNLEVYPQNSTEHHTVLSLFSNGSAPLQPTPAPRKPRSISSPSTQTAPNFLGNQPSAFPAQTNSAFGFGNSQPFGSSSSGSPFGSASKTEVPAFGGTTSAFSFGQQPTPPQQQPKPQQQFQQTAPSPFSSVSTQSPTPASVFPAQNEAKQSPQQSPFGQVPIAFGAATGPVQTAGKASAFGPSKSSPFAAAPVQSVSSSSPSADVPPKTTSSKRKGPSEDSDESRSNKKNDAAVAAEAAAAKARDEAAAAAKAALVAEKRLAEERNKMMLRRAYAAAGELERDEMLKSVVSGVVREVAKDVIGKAAEERERKRENLISVLAEEMFSSLVYDNSWQACQESMASELRRRNLLKEALKKIKATAVLAKTNADLRNKRRQQYLEASQMLGRPPSKKHKSTKRKRGMSLTPTGTPPAEERYMSEAEQINLLEEERAQVETLWRPLDLEKVFLPYAEQSCERVGLLDGVVDVSLLISDWRSPAGVWTRRKLGLEWDGQRYARHLRGKAANVTLSSMDVNPDSYSDVAGLIFMCGASGGEGDRSPSEKLAQDRETLQEALRRLRQFSSYSTSLLVCYWPLEGISSAEMQQQLGLSNYLAQGKQILSSLYVLVMDSGRDSDLSSALEMVGKSICR